MIALTQFLNWQTSGLGIVLALRLPQEEANMAKVALCDRRGPLRDLNDKLSGEKGEDWLITLKRFLRHEDPWKTESPSHSWPWASTIDLEKIQHREFKVGIWPITTIEQMVAAGKYDFVDPAHTTNACGSRRMHVEKRDDWESNNWYRVLTDTVVAFCIGHEATRLQAMQVRWLMGLREVSIDHELMIGAQHPQAQIDLQQVVNLDSVVCVNGEQYVSGLFGDGNQRQLDLIEYKRGFSKVTWFLGVESTTEGNWQSSLP
ncbi:hypothetical protein A3B21_00620 [Candidatus Uhrbacteria bacterium RIFCSPLOWO2_01_FULL_47_24]|uniref:Uncharacterized protein n=1 Tax=Candidatus Uhrbacteria bacterium RIFCSPLOWO2_01_FULL_47_24 TaxID=1802401 RepID=A0A1F7UNL2_9BACT|nr:MAG: hypothetical protein A2753_04790 [Candidatus Uhrbacteria bacterium RIFCSPHIGHO2_01_FULL_47_11]OGL67675.1 MAG: hypothetical protein A3D58_04510 [Candidatus Uhrbacteria bacterium RIFCSPHIGHO2_02_FULL_46_47]OGL74858.1 MAG: hypothetical protein A3F52_00275 [Candidatus Uhrbacteria bacterium RIFCSPHIGHO2_12_FULL_47_11]OGL79880.1 MAG: hypothetical protein A3B21_00620 [Candidatus Uhrbacteria bacterium RIFCSPLOWO2_01_FULL_47_24]OGL84100.1 MAG: hypothetical protein A3J03_03415 [Candidatus Uhrbact